MGHGLISEALELTLAFLFLMIVLSSVTYLFLYIAKDVTDEDDASASERFHH